MTDHPTDDILISETRRKVKDLMILERSSASTEDFKLTKDEKGYILEGVFGEIGVKNKNNRIYDAAEYVPQIESLQAKIKLNKLLGELDHPKQFDISLTNVSHVIEKLEYNSETKQVIGRIRILNTRKGKEAQALIDGGIPLHISSRAAGSVEENGHVKIKKLFTYDLVADPGFENAELKRINESYGFDDPNLIIYEMDEQTSSTEGDDKYINNVKNNDPQMENNPVSFEDFTNYSHYVKGEISRLEEKIKELLDGKTLDGDNNNEEIVKYSNHITEKVNDLISSFGEISEKVEKVISHNNHIVEHVNDIEGYVKYVAEKADQGIEYTKHVAEKADQGIEYTKYVAEKADQSIQYSEAVAEGANQNSDYMKYVAEKTDQSIQYTEMVAEKAERTIQYAEMIAEQTDALMETTKNIIEYGNMVSEHVGNGIGYSEYIREHVEKIGTITESLQENVNNILEGKTSVESTDTNEVELTNESVSYEDEISNKLNTIIESAKKQKAEVENPDLHFLRFLDNTKRNEFNALEEAKKLEVMEAFKSNSYYSNENATQIFESVFITKVETIDFIVNMPTEYKESWSNLTESQRGAVEAQATYYPLNTQYQINDFWATRDLRKNKVGLQAIDENANVPIVAEDKKLVSDSRLSQFEEEMKRRFQ